MADIVSEHAPIVFVAGVADSHANMMRRSKLRKQGTEQPPRTYDHLTEALTTFAAEVWQAAHDQMCQRCTHRGMTCPNPYIEGEA